MELLFLKIASYDQVMHIVIDDILFDFTKGPNTKGNR